MTTESRAKKKAKARRRRRKAASTSASGIVEADDERVGELEQQIQEHAVITDRIDALEDMKGQRKSRILLLMRDLGVSGHSCQGGSATFTTRRSFKVHDHERLAELMSPVQLASLAKVTADVYDALAESMELDEAVTVGRSESLTVSRARTKVAKERRKGHIEESKRQAEQRIADIRSEFKKTKKTKKKKSKKRGA